MTTLREAAQQALEAWDGGDTEWFKRAYSVMDALRAALAEPEGGGNLPPPLPVEFDHGIGADRFKVVRGAFWWHVLIGDSPTEHGKFRSRAGAEKMAADLLREFRNGAFVQHEAALAEPTPLEDVVTHGSAWSKDGKRIDPMSVYAEPVEPVAWRFEARHIDSAWGAAVTLKHPGPEGVYMRNVTPLYAAPPQRPAEPVAWSHINGTSDTKWHPPQRKPLTEETDPAPVFAHRLALMLECALLDPNGTWDEAHRVLDEYRAAIERWNVAHGIPYVSAFGKD